MTRMFSTRRGLLVAFAGMLLSLGAAIFVYFAFFFSGHLKGFFIGRLADATGNTFSIGGLEIHLVEPVIRLSDVVLPVPLVGPVKVDAVSVYFSRRGLFRRKFFVTDISIRGFEALGSTEVTAALDTVVPERDSPLRLAAPTPNPLKQVANLDTGMNVQSRLTQALPHLGCTEKLKGLKKQIESKRAVWIQLAGDAYRSSDLTRGTDTWAQIQREGREIEQGIQALRSGIGQDAQKIRDRLDLPSLREADLSTLLFESRVIGLLDRIAWPLSWARSHLRSESRKAKVLPRFLLARAEPMTDSTASENGGRFSALLETLSTDPRFFARPMHVVLRLDFPKLGVEQMMADIEMDYFSPVLSEKVKASIASFPIRNWELSHGHLDLRLRSGKGSTALNLNWRGDEVEGTWEMKVTDARYEIRSGQRELEEAVTERLSPLKQFSVTGTLSGTADKLRLTAASPLGKRVAEALAATYRTPLAAVDDALQRTLLDEFDPQIHSLEARYRSIKQQAWFQLQGKKLKKSRGVAEQK